MRPFPEPTTQALDREFSRVWNTGGTVSATFPTGVRAHPVHDPCPELVNGVHYEDRNVSRGDLRQLAAT